MDNIIISYSLDPVDITVNPVPETVNISISESTGPIGPQGEPGIGIKTGGTTGQILAKKSNANYDTEWISNSGLGDMLKSTYDVDNNGIVDNAEKLGGVLPSGYSLSSHNHTGVYQPIGTYSTDIHSNITALNAVSGVNTGDQNLSGYMLKSVYDINNDGTVDYAKGSESALTDYLGNTIHSTYQPIGSYEVTTNKNQANGYSGLDSGGKIPVANLPTTLLQYIGTWNPAANLPALTTPDLTKVGYVYNVSVAGTRFGIDWKLGDWAIYNASGIIEKSDNSDDVTSVNGYTGSVVLNSDDILYTDLSVFEALNGMVPYTGSTSDVNLGSYKLLAKGINLPSTSPSTINNGDLYYDPTELTLVFKGYDGTTLQIGEEQYVAITNRTGIQINDGSACYINNAQGNRPTATIANSNTLSSSSVIGIATQDIADNASGKLTTFGIVHGFNTTGMTDGGSLWLNGTSISQTKPTTGYIVHLGYALNSTTNGSIFVNPSRPLAVDLTSNSDEIAPTVKAVKTANDLKRDRTEIGDAHGFVNPPNASNFTISNTGSSVTVNLLSNAGAYKINGTDYANSGLSKTFTAQLGQNFLYITSAGLQASTTVWDILDTTAIPCATVNWDGTNVRLADELHRSNRNLMEHKKQHDTDGARYVSGFATTFGSSANNTFSSALGTIRDEERYHDIAAKTSAQIAYRNSALTAMIFDAASTTYAKMNSLVPRYDNAGTLTDIANGNYGISWMFATNAKLPTNSEIVFVLGQGTYTSLALAQAAAQPTLSGMSVAEWKLLYRVIYRNVGGALLFVQADDFRLTTTGLAVSGTGATANLVTDYSMVGNGTSVSPFALNDELRARRAERCFFNDFMYPPSGGTPNTPYGFYKLAVLSGTGTYALGYDTYSSSTSANSGYYNTFGAGGSGIPQTVPIATLKQIDCVLSITKPTVKNRIIRIGTGASMSSTPTNGIYFEIADTGAITAKCNGAGTITSISTGITPVNGTQYHFRIKPTSTSCDFSIFAADGTLLSNLQITTNIPTSDLGLFAMFVNQGTEVVEIGKLYHLSFTFNSKSVGAIN